MTTALAEADVGQEYAATAKREMVKLDKEAKAIAQEFLTWDLRSRERFAKLGGSCWEYLQHARNILMPEKEARDRLAKDILAVTGTDYTKEIGRAIKAYQLSVVLGEDTLKMPTDMQKAFTTFLFEDTESGNWSLDPQYAAGVMRAFRKIQRAIAEHAMPTCEQVRADLAKIKPLRKAPQQPEGITETASTAGQPEGWLTLPDPSGIPTPHHPVECMEAARKVLAASEDRPKTLTLLAKNLGPEDLVEIVGGFCARLRDYDDPKKAREELEFVRSSFDERAKGLETSLGRKPKKS